MWHDASRECVSRSPFVSGVLDRSDMVATARLLRLIIKSIFINSHDGALCSIQIEVDGDEFDVCLQYLGSLMERGSGEFMS
jgi:hypothetical protein